MDALSDLLSSIRVRTASWTTIDARAPWGVSMTDSTVGFCIHHVVRGAACFASGDQMFELTAGDVVVVPHGGGHALRDHIDSTVVPAPAEGHLSIAGLAPRRESPPRGSSSRIRSAHRSSRRCLR